MAEDWQEELDRIAGKSPLTDVFKELDKVAPPPAAAPAPEPSAFDVGRTPASDELANAILGPSAQAAPTEDWQAELNKLAPPPKGAWELFGAGLERAKFELGQLPAALEETKESALATLGLGGDQEKANIIAETRKLEKEAAGLPEKQEVFERVWNDPSRWGPWAAEIAGDSMPSLVAGAVAGVALAPVATALGAGAGAVAGASLLARFLPKAIPYLGGALTAAGLELPGTASALYEATGEAHGATAAGLSLAKGAVEMGAGVGPAVSKLAGSLVSREAGKRAAGKAGETFIGRTGKIALGEMGEEGIQTEMDIQALAEVTEGQKNPIDRWGTESWWQRAEALAGGAVLGTGFGAPTALAQRKLSGEAEPTRESDPGYTSGYSPVEEVARGVKNIPELQAPVPVALDKTLKDIVHPVSPATDDAFDLHLQLKQLQLENGPERAAIMEAIEGGTDRYVLVGPDGVRASPNLYTDTELEQELAIRPQGEQLQVVKVNPRSIDLREMTADVLDLPAAESGKVWFLPETPAEQRVQLLEQYRQLQQSSQTAVELGDTLRSVAVEQQSRSQLEAKMRPLLAAGLRVIPSHGRGFWYNGKFQGEAVTPESTGRTKQIGIYNPTTRSIELDHRGWLTQSSRPGIPVSLDLRRLKPGDVSGVPQRLPGQSYRDMPGWEFRKGVTAETKKRLFDEIDAGGDRLDTAQIHKLMSEGIWYAPSKGLYALVPRPGLDIRAYTHGVRRDRGKAGWIHTEGSGVVERGRAAAKQEKSTVFVEKQPGVTLTPSAAKMQVVLEREVKKYLPTIDRLLRKYGIQGGLKISITTFQNNSILLEEGTMFLNPENFVRYGTTGLTTGSTELDINSIILHELGHMVTYSLYRKLPLFQKLRLRHAYHRALVADRLQADSIGSRVISEVTAGQPASNTRYYQSFSEWLAEQFRRHARTDTEIRNEFELPFKEVADGVKRFYADYEKAHGTAAAFNLRHPDHVFGAVLESIQSAEKKMAPVRRLEQAQERWRLADGLPFSGVSQEVISEVARAVESLGPLALPDTATVIAERFDSRLGEPDPGALLRITQQPGSLESFSFWSRNANPVALLELAIGSLKTKQAYEYTRDVVSQGWMHSYMEAGLLSDAEIEQLAAGARLAGVNLGGNTTSVLRDKAKAFGKDFGWDAQQEAAYVEKMMQRMLVAEYVAANVNRFDAPGPVQVILRKIVEVLHRIQDRLMGTGYHSREQLLHSIFKGEIADRAKKAEETEAAVAPVPQAGGVSHGATNAIAEDLARVVPVDNELHVYVTEHGGSGAAAKEIFYYFYRGPMASSMAEKLETDYVGYVNLKNRAELGFEVGMVEVTAGFRRQGYATRMHRFWQQELGVEHKPSGVLLEDGYRYWRRRKPDAVRYHIHDYQTEQWISPRKVEQYIILQEQALATPNLPPNLKDYFTKQLQYYKLLRKSVNPKAWGDPELKQLFAVDSAALNGIQAAVTRGGIESDIQETENVITGSSAPTNDAFEGALQEELQWSQAENAEVLGIPFEESAPETMQSTPIRQLTLGALNLPPEDRRAMREVAAQQDRIGFFSRKWWGLQQLAWVNTHIGGLRNYVQHVDQMGQRVTAWTTRADETARAWQKLPQRQQESLGEIMFWLAEMRYRSAEEIQNEVVRQPTDAELEAELNRRRFTDTQRRMLERVQSDFSVFLADVERIKEANLTRTIADPQALGAAIAQLRVEMAQLRAKPYFPFVRFGRHTITVRDSDNKVVWFSAYETAGERNRNMAGVAARFPRGSFIQKGMIPEEAAQFMGLPPPLISHIKATMPDLNAVQSDWLDQFAAAHLPGNSFRRRWLKKAGTQGFSLDAFRAYAHYFTHGSRYLARMEFDPLLREDIAEVRSTTAMLADNTKRVMILEEMQKHHKYISNDPKDFSRWRALAALYHLGFSVTAAMMNLTQTMTMTSPYLRSTFGTPAIRTWNNTLRMMRRGATTRGLGPVGSAARAEMVRQGRIDIGQVSELGSFAEGYNLMRWSAGTRAQRALREFSWWGMFAFGKVEQFNRELAFRCAWDLALKNPDNPKLTQIGLDYNIEIGELVERLGWSHQEAVAFLYARETIDRTQGNYAPWAKPAFLRNRWAGLALMFTQYLQNLVYAFRWNGATLQMLLIFMVLYGTKGGIPGGEDMEEVLKSIGWHFFGRDWDLSKQARKFVRDMSRGTVFDEVGPDLLMHGISRYGFGVGLLPEWIGAPRFDVSTNGSIGKVVPGLQDTLRKLRYKSDWDGASSTAMQAIGGAPLSPLFALMQYMAEPPGTINSHRWEGALPRFLRDGAKAERYRTEGETSRQGGRVVQFDWSDQVDASSIIAAYLGLKPTKVTQHWEAERAFADSAAIYEARKLDLYGQAYMAHVSKEPQVIKDVISAIERYNADARAAGALGMQIDGARLQASIKARTTAVMKQEAGIPQKKGQIQLQEQMLDLFPGVKAERERQRAR